MKNETNNIRARYNRIAPFYNLMDRMIELSWRQNLLKNAKGSVLEVGVGTGANLPYYGAEVKITGIDFSEKMLELAIKKADEIGMPSKLVLMDAQAMSFPDNSFDTVVTSCVFCSVPDPVQGLREIRRVCKPDGQILMLEHVRSDNKIVGPLMDLINPIPLYLAGANINRNTIDNLKLAGFTDMEVENLRFDIVKFIRIINFKSTRQ